MGIMSYNKNEPLFESIGGGIPERIKFKKDNPDWEVSGTGSNERYKHPITKKLMKIREARIEAKKLAEQKPEIEDEKEPEPEPEPEPEIEIEDEKEPEPEIEIEDEK